MLPLPVIVEHFGALVFVWSCAVVAGFPLLRLMRLPLGLGGAALLGLTYWATTLYLLPFSHGLDVAIGIALCGFFFAIITRPPSPRRLWASLNCQATAILLVGCVPFASILFTHYVPRGMDASMHTTGARLIAELQGLPTTYAPFAPELHLPSVNLGLPALVAVPVRFGCSPPAAMLGGEQLTFSLFILSTYLLLRLWTRPTTAAVLAVFAIWTSRGAQETAGWGGFPTVAALALGLFATRLLIDLVRHPNFRLASVLGLTIAAIPLTHGIGAAAWFYAVAPVALLIGLLSASRRMNAIGFLAVSAAVTAVVLLAYLANGYTRVSPDEVAWARDYQQNDAPKGDGTDLLFSVPAYIKTHAGSAAIWPGAIAIGVLLVRGRFRAATALALAFVLLCLVIANSRYWLLPMSMLLYPERTVYWATPLAACAMALAWQSLGLRVRGSLCVRFVLLCLMIPVALLKHGHSFQLDAIAATISAAEWDSLAWSERNLNPQQDFVESTYQTAGSYLPCVAGIATTGWHMHFFALQEIPVAMRNRAITHRFVIRKKNPDLVFTTDQVVFQNSEVIILRLAK